jgi:hypothetical protein
MKLDCDGVVFGPDRLRAMYRAYDEAFHALEPDLSPDPVAVHCVKMKLALAITALAKLQRTHQPLSRAINLSRSAAPRAKRTENLFRAPVAFIPARPA